jgi:hypothetical protein
MSKPYSHVLPAVKSRRRPPLPALVKIPSRKNSSRTCNPSVAMEAAAMRPRRFAEDTTPVGQTRFETPTLPRSTASTASW